MDEQEQAQETKVELTDSQKSAIDAVKEQVAKAIDKDFIEDMTKNNKMEFTHEGVTYRIGKANYEQKQEVYRERVKKFTSLLRDKEYSLEKDLKRDYLARGIDVDGIVKNIQTLDSKKTGLQVKLGELLKKDGSEQDCAILKKEIESIINEQTELALEKQSLLEFSIENQVLVHVYNYLTYMSTERKEGEVWVKAFKTFSDFMKSDDVLVGKLAFLITMMNQDVV
jgi:hypothetical protein